MYSPALQACLGEEAPAFLPALGNLNLLHSRKLALFCSVKCPGKLILQTYDFAQALRQGDWAVMGGFHSPMEKECLSVLLRGPEPVIVCLARDLEGARLPAEYRQPLEEGRLLLLSRSAKETRRMDAEVAFQRNRFVGALADAVFVAHAQPGGKTEQFCREVLSWGKSLYTFESDANANLLAMGARTISIGTWLGLQEGEGIQPPGK